MELTSYIRLVRRWFWLIGLVAIVSGSLGFISSRSQIPKYTTAVTVQVGTYLNLANPDTSMIATGEQLAQTYAALVKTYPVLQATVDKLNLPFSSDALAGLTQVNLVQSTSLLTIQVTYTDPIVAADIANELARQLIANSPTTLTQEQQQQLELLNAEIQKAQNELKNSRDELAAIDKTLSSGTPDNQTVSLTARRTELVNQINTAQANLAQMSTTVIGLQQQGNVNSLVVVDPARIPEGAIGSSNLMGTTGMVFVGAALAVGIAFAFEYLNDSVRTPAEVMNLLNVGPIGTIPPFGKKKTYKDKLITWMQPRSTISESYRALRVSLMYTEKDRSNPLDCRLYLVSSPGPEEGKSVTIANLAVTFAQAGMRVILIDADLRRPSQHQIFGVSNTAGLSSLWTRIGPGKREGTIDRLDMTDAGSGTMIKPSLVRQNLMLSLPHIIQKTTVPGLDLIPAGPTPSNPAELLGTAQMQELVSQLQSSKNYDVILFDTPPMLVVSDTSILANVTQGGVILIIQAGRTRRGSLARVVEQMNSLSVPLLGVVMNRLHPRDVDSTYNQYYYYGYYGYGQNTPSAPVETISENGRK